MLPVSTHDFPSEENNARDSLQNISHTSFSFTLMLPSLAVRDLKQLLHTFLSNAK